MRGMILSGLLMLGPVYLQATVANDENARANTAVIEMLERQEEATVHAVRSRNINLLNYGIASLHGAAGMAHASSHFAPACVSALSMLHAVMSNIATSAPFDGTRTPELNAALRLLRTPESLDGVGRMYTDELAACEKSTGLKLVARYLPARLSDLVK